MPRATPPEDPFPPIPDGPESPQQSLENELYAATVAETAAMLLRFHHFLRAMPAEPVRVIRLVMGYLERSAHMLAELDSGVENGGEGFGEFVGGGGMPMPRPMMMPHARARRRRGHGRGGIVGELLEAGENMLPPGQRAGLQGVFEAQRLVALQDVKARALRNGDVRAGAYADQGLADILGPPVEAPAAEAPKKGKRRKGEDPVPNMNMDVEGPPIAAPAVPKRSRKPRVAPPIG